MIKKITLTILFAFLLAAALSVHPFGEPVFTKMDDYFIRNGQEETGSNNIVSSVLFDYRALDTLGEASILFAAAAGVFIILAPLEINRIRKKRREGKSLMGFRSRNKYV